MKRIISVFLTLIFLMSVFLIPSTANASENVETVFTYGEITVIFSEDSTLTLAQRREIAGTIANSHSHAEHTECEDHECKDNAEQPAQQRNILCNIFGHKKKTESITVVEHCVRENAPRCKETFGDLTTCSRCNYSDFVEITSSYIFCH